MHQLILASFLLVFSLSAQAQALLLNDLKAQNAVQLTVDELRQQMPSAKVVNRTEAGSTRRWSNDQDGTFIASSDSRGSTGRQSQGKGTWHIGDNGTYCVTLEWKTSSENWCRYIFKIEDKYYGVSSIANGRAKAYEFEFAK